MLKPRVGWGIKGELGLNKKRHEPENERKHERDDEDKGSGEKRRYKLMHQNLCIGAQTPMLFKCFLGNPGVEPELRPRSLD